MYVRHASSSWSTVLYAAAALDDDIEDAEQTTAVAKAYVSRAAREVAHGALQVFGGIAFTEEHPAHRFLRRIVVREQQFGDAAPSRARDRPHASPARDRRPSHAASPVATPPRRRSPERSPPWARPRPRASTTRPPSASSSITTGADPEVVGPLLADVLHDPRWLESDVALVSGGKSNLTYRVASDAGEVILRRPPLGQHPPDRPRHGARAPRPERARRHGGAGAARRCYIGDAEAGLGAPFYVMERVLGHICRNALPPGLRRHPGRSPRHRRGAGRRARRPAHVDPAAVGLAEFGRPAGFMERQLRRWSQQWEASRTDELPALDALRDDLVRTLPAAAGARDRPRRLPPGQHDPAPHRARAASSPSSTGR